MAKSNSISNTGIPEGDRKAVTQYRGWMIADGKKHVTNEQAYREVLRGRAMLAEAQAKAQAEKEASDKAREIENRARALEDLERGLSALADVRDLLGQMKLGKLDYFDDKTLATFARATLVDAGTEVEQSLRELGVLKDKQFGYFAPDLPEEPEAQEAA